MEITKLRSGGGFSEEAGMALSVRRSAAPNGPSEEKSRLPNRSTTTAAGSTPDYIDVEATAISAPSPNEDGSESRLLTPVPERQTGNQVSTTGQKEFYLSTPLNYSVSRRNGSPIEVRYDSRDRGQLLNVMA